MARHYRGTLTAKTVYDDVSFDQAMALLETFIENLPDATPALDGGVSATKDGYAVKVRVGVLNLHSFKSAVGALRKSATCAPDGLVVTVGTVQATT